MRRFPRALLLLALSLALACTTAASARRAAIRRGLDEARLSRSPAEIWPEVQRFLHERGYPLVGEDRVAIGQKAQGALGKLFSRGFETRVRNDGSRILETDADRYRMRVRAEGRATPGGGSQLVITMLKESEMNPIEYSESRDLGLELDLLERIEPAVAARIRGTGPAGAATGGAPADPWAPLRHLLGSWSGALPGGAEVRWRFAFTDGVRFLEVRGSPLLFAGPTARPDAGEEMGRISRDAAGGLAWNQFTYSGRADRWQLEPSGPDAVVFLSPAPESLPAGSRARLTLRRYGDEQLVATLELAEAGKDLAPAGEVRLKRER